MNSQQQTSKVKNNSSSKVFKNPAYNVTIYIENYQQFNLVGCFSHRKFRIFNQKCSITLLLLISHMKLFNRTKKLELNMNIEFGRAVLSTIAVSRRKLWNHLSNPGIVL